MIGKIEVVQGPELDQSPTFLVRSEPMPSEIHYGHFYLEYGYFKREPHSDRGLCLDTLVIVFRNFFEFSGVYPEVFLWNFFSQIILSENGLNTRSNGIYNMWKSDFCLFYTWWNLPSLRHCLFEF